MRNYELMTIAKSSLTDEQSKKISKEIQELIASLKGTVSKTDYWGKRKLAYEAKGLKEGYYDVIWFSINPIDLKKIENKLALTENLLKYLITLDSATDVKAVKKETKAKNA